MAKTGAKRSTKAESHAADVAAAVGAGLVVGVETVDFNEPNRPKTCLEVDFPILPVNQVAMIEGNAGKPIYQMSKWWARRRSSVFRSMLLAASMKAPDDPAQAAKAVWDVYYANHQKKGALKGLKVADIFMGGGTTLVEGSRLGMQMFGTDLNPVAWFIVKNELASVTPEEVKSLLDEVEAAVKPQIVPFYACECPRGHKGRWTNLPTGRVEAEGFDALSFSPAKWPEYRYDGPEIIYVFWAKHGPCQVTGCGHRTPLMSSPVVAVKTLTVKAWERRCPECRRVFDIEAAAARMAPAVPLFVSDDERPFTVVDPKQARTRCPHCGHRDHVKLGKHRKKKVELTLLVHPEWLAGASGRGADGTALGGSVTDTPEATAAWNRERARTLRLLEVRGTLPDEVTCPETGVRFSTAKGTVPKKSTFACGACGTVQDVLETVKASGKTGPVAVYAVQGYCPGCDAAGLPYGGRFFAPVLDPVRFDRACAQWAARKDGDLAAYWPREPLFRYERGNTSMLYNQPQHGFSHWWMMFNPRQLLVHTQLLRAIVTGGGGERHRPEVRDYVLGAFQQYLRNQNMFCFWNITGDKLEPMFSNNNFHPKSTVIENCVFARLGRGNWLSCSESLAETSAWARQPWEVVSVERLKHVAPALAEEVSGKSEKVECGDPVCPGADVACVSATDLSLLGDASCDLVVTDPPFGGLIHYADLADFFHVWLRLVLKEEYAAFQAGASPRSLEVIANRALEAEPDTFYQRLLTECWREAYRILKPGGLLAFTFHHSADDPWVAVLESLFDAGFYLEATYPIRSDETKGSGAQPGTFGAQTIEYDIIHVCRKRTEDPKPVSWGRMRREVLEDVRRLQGLLEHHAKEGLPAADLQVIKRGKALEYFSRHYGKVYVDEDRPVSVRDALLGINQLLDEETGKAGEPPPVQAEPFTRQFLRIFDGKHDQARDQMQKFLRGTGIAPHEFVDRGWCTEEKKVFRLTPALEIARSWEGRHRRNMLSDYDQAMFLIGACYDGSSINASDTLRNKHFRPHRALEALLDWHARRGGTADLRNAAARAQAILQAYERSQKAPAQLSFFDEG